MDDKKKLYEINCNKEIDTTVFFTKRENGKTKVLLLSKKDELNNKNIYDLPESIVKNNEELFDSILRELNDELLVSINRNALRIIHIMNIPSQNKVFIVFKSTKKINPRIHEKSKCQNILWAKLNELPLETSMKTRKIIKNITNKKIYDYM